MCQVPRCAALLCCPLLLPPLVHVAHLAGILGGAARAGVAADLGAQPPGRLGSPCPDDAGGMPPNESAAVAKGLWAQAHAAGCLERSLRPGGGGWQRDLVHLVWKHELWHIVAPSIPKSLHSYVRSKIQDGALRHRSGTGPADEQARREGEEREARDREELAALKGALRSEYSFDYDAVKQRCVLDQGPGFNLTMDMADEEFVAGCGGNCSKRSIFSNECRETSEGTFCPEGTHCGCHFKSNPALAAVAGTAAYLAFGGLIWAMLGPVPAMTLPGHSFAGAFAAALAASSAQGCRCVPSECAWDTAKGACAPVPAKGAGNPFQAVLPYVGMKCSARTSGWRVAFRGTTNTSFLGPGCEAAQPCAPEDAARIGQVGMDTLNCIYTDSAGNASTLYPPLAERLNLYRNLFPHAGPGADPAVLL